MAKTMKVSRVPGAVADCRDAAKENPERIGRPPGSCGDDRTGETRETNTSAITLRKRIAIAALALLAVLLAGGALLGLRDVYQNHIARECGADCGRPAASGDAVQGGL